MKSITKQFWLCRWKGQSEEWTTHADPTDRPFRDQVIVLSGPITVDFPVSEHVCPHCQGPLPEPTIPEPFQITGIGKYKTRNGETISVRGEVPTAHNIYWGRDKDGRAGYWFVDGRCNRATDTPHDLVERIS